ncbi:MAG: SCO family protein [Xanthomonadaceae bacterium]|nr:SCO family protein [Xanthomonadaceae bacterium]
MSTPPKHHWLIVAIVAVAVLFGAWLYLRPGHPRPSRPATQTITWHGEPRALPDFRLNGAEGASVTPATLRGHWTLVFLGFTSCPDICPTTLLDMAKAQNRWHSLPEATRPLLLFVSADPERDDLPRLAGYARAFHEDTIAATADIPTLERFIKPLGLVFMKVPNKGYPENPLDYTIDHSANVAVLDPQGRLAGAIRAPLDPEAIAEDLRKLTQDTTP